MTNRSQPPDAFERPALEIGEDLKFQRRTWRVQRIGWTVMVLLIGAAVSGVFASGPLSEAETRDPDGTIGVEYERFVRRMAPTTLRIRFLAPVANADRVAIEFGNSFIRDVEIETVRPEPEHMTAMPDGVRMAFRLAQGGGAVTLSIKPQAVGSLRGEVGIVGRRPARLSQFVYP